tara:strand:+ start:2272 stop:2619 length:348 start_codon:yes stop_codon:yes gene_type:complete
MSYRLITFSVLLFLLGHIFVWMQLNGPILWPTLKKYKFLLAIMGIPITYIFMEATRLTIEGFEGLFWPGRFVAFVCGITIFTLFTYLFKGEAITLKTATSLLLAFSIIIIQLFWK